MDDILEPRPVKRTALGQAIIVPEPPASWHRSQRVPTARKDKERAPGKEPGKPWHRRRREVATLDKQRTLDAIATGLLSQMPLAMVAISAGGIPLPEVCLLARCKDNKSSGYVRRLVRQLCRDGYVAGIPDDIHITTIVYPTPAGVRLASAALAVIATGSACDGDMARAKMEKMA